MYSRIALAIVITALPAFARTRAVRHPSAAPASVMWIGAHPDDEAVAAPLLAKWCRDENARCAFLILTRGEAGPCLLANGCHPDVATVRSAEAGAASQYFRATSILLRLPDGGGVLPPQWPDVTQEIADYIRAFRPDTILTFDPRHGTTCHPDHMQTAVIALEAVKRLPYDPAVYLLETRVTFSPLRFEPAAAEAERFDATASWPSIIEDMRHHPSQFDETTIAAVANLPLAERAVWLARADAKLTLFPCASATTGD